MKSKIDGWSILIVGQWNPAIFSPDWVLKYLFETPKGQNQEISMQIPVGLGILGISLLIDKIRISPSNNCLEIKIEDTSKETLQKAESISLNAVKKLSHTPVMGYGINFAFVESRPQIDLLSLFDASDINLLNENNKVIKRTLSRSIKVDSAVLNLTIGLNEEEGNVYFDLNFHHDTKSCAEISADLSGRFVHYHNIALELLQNIYKLELDNGEGKSDEK